MFTRFLSFKGGDEMRDEALLLEKDQSGNLISYVRLERIYEREFLKMMETADYLGKNLILQKHSANNLSSFMQKVYDFEMQHNKKEKRIFAVALNILLPRSIDSDDLKKKFIRHFFKCLIPDCHINISYYAYSYSQGEGNYIRLIIFERAYLNKRFYVRYKQDYYTYTKNKEGVLEARKTRKKGDFKLNEHGKKIKELVLFSEKLRLFNFSTISEFKNKTREVMETALKMISDRTKEVNKLRFKKKTLYVNMRRMKKRIIIEINQFKAKLEYYLNQHYSPLHYSLSTEYESYDYELARLNNKSEKEQLTDLKKIYDWISGIFEKNVFFYKQENRYINYRYVPLDKLKENIELLFDLFMVKLSNYCQKFKISRIS